MKVLMILVALVVVLLMCESAQSFRCTSRNFTCTQINRVCSSRGPHALECQLANNNCTFFIKKCGIFPPNFNVLNICKGFGFGIVQLDVNCEYDKLDPETTTTQASTTAKTNSTSTANNSTANANN